GSYDAYRTDCEELSGARTFRLAPAQWSCRETFQA
nr:Chain A, S1P4 First Extracellular Loop Peptidomimetic [Homo sapiens]